MTGYSQEHKDDILKLLLPPHNMTVPEVSRQKNISTKTLYRWRNFARKTGQPVPGKTKHTEDWSAETKLAVIIETATLSETELSQYCREKGLYVEQLKRWKVDLLEGLSDKKSQRDNLLQQAKADKSEIKLLKQDLRYKEKALAETVALLVLRKKLNALWQDESGEN